MSRFLHCMTCWSQACKTALKPVESVYKRAVKIHKKPRQYHHCPILEKHNLLNFENILLYANICQRYKILHGTAPPLNDFVSLTSEKTTRVTRSSSNGVCSVPKCKTALA